MNANYAILRSILGVILGVVLIFWPDVAVIYLVMLIGVFFLAPGVYKLIAWFRRDKSSPEVVLFPVDAIGSILFGLWLLIMPAFFVNILMYVLGVLILLAGAQQIFLLFICHKRTPVPWGFYVMPVLICLTGILILAYPFGTLTSTFIIFGGACIIYGITELLNWFTFRPGKLSWTHSKPKDPEK